MEVLPLIISLEEKEKIISYINKRNLDFSIFAKEIILNRIEEELKREREESEENSRKDKGSEEEGLEESLVEEMWENADV